MHNLSAKTIFFFAILVLLAAISSACSDRSPAGEQGVGEATLPRSVATSQPAQPTSPPPENNLEPTAIPPTPTLPPTGMSRSNPYPRSEVVSVPGWEVQVLEVIRGEQAWSLIQSANMFNKPAPEGMEYLLVKLRAKSTSTDDPEPRIQTGIYRVTGDRLIEYFQGSAVPPSPTFDPVLEGRSFSGGETEGWIVYLIGKNEGNLIFLIGEPYGYGHKNKTFIQLEDGASIRVNPDLQTIQPNDLGKDRNNPATISQKVITQDWEITVLEVVRGEPAFAMVKEADELNNPPPSEGREYLAVKMRLRYIGSGDEAVSFEKYAYCATIGDKGQLYVPPTTNDPKPELWVTLYPGGEFEGWVVMEAAVGETGLKLIFDPISDTSGENRRFLALE